MPRGYSGDLSAGGGLFDRGMGGEGFFCDWSKMLLCDTNLVKLDKPSFHLIKYGVYNMC